MCMTAMCVSWWSSYNRLVMKRAVKYLEIQLKRVLRSFPAVFLITLILVGAMLLVARGVLEESLSDEKQTMIEIGIVGDIEDSYLGIGILALQQLDTSRFAINFHMLEEKEARQALLSGELTAYLVVPDGFVDSVVRGENYSLKYYTSNGQMGLGTMLMNELTVIVSDLITQSQSGIYGMQSICLEYGYQEVCWTATNDLNLQYIDLILDRMQFFEVEILGISNNLSTQGYYICGFTVLFFMIFGIHGGPIFVRKDVSLSKILATNGVNAFCQVVIEFVAYLLLTLTCVLGVVAFLGVACEKIEVSVQEWRTVDFERVFSFGVSLVPVLVMLTAMALFCHELTDNIVSGMLLQFLAVLGMGYVSGCFYPASFFPEAVLLLGKLLPSGVAIQYASQSMLEEMSAGVVLGTVAYTVVFVGAAGVLRQRKFVKN